MQVPLLDLRQQYEQIRGEVEPVILEVCRSQGFVLGPRVEKFEEEVAEYCQTRFALGVSSGTDALLLALMALGVGEGDEVITSPFTFFATAGCIARVGARPVFVDIASATFNIDPALIEAKITERTRAILPVHLFGQCADMNQIMGIADRHALPVIEDACQAIGADSTRGRAGGVGTYGCFSFYPSKNLAAFGDAGLLTTNDGEFCYQAKLLRTHGEAPRYFHHLVGGNFRLDALQAAVLSVKLAHLEGWHEARARHAELYAEWFTEKGIAGDSITLPAVTQPRHVFNQYTIRAQRRDVLKDFLDKRGIGSAIYYPVPLHLQDCFSYLRYRDGDLPEAEKAAKEVLSIPVYPELTEEMQEAVVEAIAEFYGG